MTKYAQWIRQRRILYLTGSVFLFGGSLATFNRHHLPLNIPEQFGLISMAIGGVIFLIANLYGEGGIRRQWIKDAIREENERMRS